MARIPRIPAPVIDQLPKPETTIFVQPPVINGLQQPIINVPSYEPPTYAPPTGGQPPDAEDVFDNPPPPAPPVVPSIPTETIRETVDDNTREMQEEAEATQGTPGTPEVPLPPPPPGAVGPRPEIDVPFVGVVPLPYQREVALAGTTAVAATAAALIGKSLVELLIRLMKPVVRRIMLKMKERSNRQFTDYELQLFFGFERRTPEQKRLMKRLKKELEEEKAEQLEEWALRQHQNKQKHMGTKDESEHLREQPHHNEVIERVQSQGEP